MIITTQFKSKKTGAYGGRKYSYRCDIPGVKPGDLVKVKTPKGEDVVLVTEVNVPEEQIDPGVLGILKSVIGPAEDSPAASAVTCETCDEFTPIGEGDHICGADPHKMPIREYLPTGDYCWCRGKHYVKS